MWSESFLDVFYAVYSNIKARLTEVAEHRYNNFVKIIRMNYNRILELAEGDNTFIVALLNENIKIFDELKTTYADAMKNNDLKALKFVNHRAHSCIQLLDIQDLGNETKKGEELILYPDENKELIDKNVLEVKRLCDEVIKELQDYTHNL